MEGYTQGAISHWNTGVAGAHLCVKRDGTVVLTCHPNNTAWHAGTDASTGRTQFWKSHNINLYSIGVELEGFAATGYTKEQIDACVRIGKYFCSKYGIPNVHNLDSIPGHHTHAEVSNQRSDPGPHFPLDDIIRRIG